MNPRVVRYLRLASLEVTFGRISLCGFTFFANPHDEEFYDRR